MNGDVLGRVRQTIAAHRLVRPGARVIVAVSGGPDSVVLLQCLQSLSSEWRLTLRMAHLDHALREGSRGDAAFVEALGRRWRIPTTVERRDVGTMCSKEGWSLEEGARRVRYQFLLDEAKRYSASVVALAHTADDQAETVLMRLIRGAGVTGLRGMPMRRPLGPDVWVVRPLLECWREDVVAFLTREQLGARHDASNDDRRFLRNRIRHELLPLVAREYNPNIKAALVQLAGQCASDVAFLQDEASRQWKRVVKEHGAPPAVTIAIAKFLRQPKALQRQVVRRAISRVRGDLNAFEYRHWLEAERLFTERGAGSHVDLPGGIQLRRESDRVVCHRDAGEPTVPLSDEGGA